MSVIKSAMRRAIEDLQAEQASGRNVGRAVAFLEGASAAADRPLDLFWSLKQATRTDSQFLAIRRG